MLTIGMACYDDFDGIFFTCQALRLYHDIEKRGIEIVIIDNNPKSKHGQEVKHYASKIPCIKYIPFEEAKGTTQSREMVFKHASQPYVMCIDSHVMLIPGAIEKLLQYYEQNPDTKDLLTGPLLYDNFKGISTHFDLIWRSHMWGTWSNAWKTPTGKIYCVREKDGKCDIHLVSNGNFVRRTEIAFPGHEAHFVNNEGWQPLGFLDDDDPFEIQAQGLGLFTCKKEHWVGFNPKFRKFGGEEGYIHEKFRNAGAKCLCLPFLKWNHRFSRPNGVPYPIDILSRIRNYVIGHKELDLDLNPVRDHFIQTKAITTEQWDILVENDEVEIENNKIISPKPGPNFTVPDLIEWAKKHEKSFQHMWEIIPKYVNKCDIVTELTLSPLSASLFLQSDIRRLNTYIKQSDDILNMSKYIAHQNLKNLVWKVEITEKPEIEWTECLFVNGRANQETVEHILSQHKMVGRFLMIHKIVGYGARGDDGGVGLAQMVGDFLKNNSEWFIVDSVPDDLGLLILGKEPQDKPAEKMYYYPPGHGPGTELSKLLKWFGISAKPNCPCKRRANAMDMRGCKWCEENFDTIIKWLEEEANNRKLPFVKRAAEMMVNRAIKRARKTRAKLHE